MEDKRISALAQELMDLARDMIAVNLRFLDMAVFALTPLQRESLGGASCDGTFFYYDPVWLLQKCRDEQGFAMRLYLHTVLHCIFRHMEGYEKMNRGLWDTACDAAVENIILEADITEAALTRDIKAAKMLSQLEEKMNPEIKEDYFDRELWVQEGESGRQSKRRRPLTCDHIYSYLADAPKEEAEFIRELAELVHMDEHLSWRKKAGADAADEIFKKIARRIKTELKSFSKNGKRTGSFELSLERSMHERTDYAQMLQSFACVSEDMEINDDEFDYIYYNYGLEHYGNMPFVEPLEYRDVRKIRDFVIVIDTSASCKRELVAEFLKKTAGILAVTESFFDRTNIHILQCDHEVRNDTVIHDVRELDGFFENVRVEGMGATDFRPAFEYTDRLIGERQLQDMKGLIYFTDGFGIYPERAPGYKALFAFANEDETRPPLPPWAAGAVVRNEGIDRNINTP